MNQFPAYHCPHCNQPNPPFEYQRCQHCNINMLSDRDFQMLSSELRPMMENISGQVEKLEQSAKPKMVVDIQRKLEELTPYREEFDFVGEWMTEVNHLLEPHLVKLARLRRTLLMNMLILFVLALAPLAGMMMGGDSTLILMLCLPVLGWLWIGIFGILRREVWCIALLVTMSLQSTAQPHNGEIISQLADNFLKKTTGSFAEVNGFDLMVYTTAIHKDTMASQTLNARNPFIQYKPVDKKAYLRRVEMALSITGEKQLDTLLVYEDTLTGNILRKLNRQSPDGLKADDPSVFGRIVKPVGIVVASIGGIISLFYIRSR